MTSEPAAGNSSTMEAGFAKHHADTVSNPTDNLSLNECH
jgi:hypothetical protein